MLPIIKKKIKESNEENGPFEKFYKHRNSGLLKEKGNYKNGNLDGDWQDYYENGQERTKGNYIEGIPFGLWEYFTEEGLLRRKTTYNKKGSEEGYFENYHMNGKIRSRGFYKNQQYDGLWELFYQNGQISQRGNFKDGERVGRWEYFHESGVSLDPDYYFSYQMDKSSDEQEYTPENNDALETEMNFVVVASYYVFHADNEFPDPKWGSKQRKRASFIKELDAWRELCGEERANKFQTFIFEHDADFQRDQKTIAALETLQQSSTVELLSKTLGIDTRRMVNFLMFAEQHENTTGVKSTFNELKTWKTSRSYK